ncbi:hypothetical protein GDO86_005145 [Hymenochirus boettgeri]|uniref:Fructose-2,6-bisphosphatase TIGAR n=2 Tax=Hymenochirus boettgeri TaxID=247094 RepID=A0A8T2J883_9PIPI|nr:hypothetical protein GDO86_005145 [Hymenochirus boettgeri]
MPLRALYIYLCAHAPAVNLFLPPGQGVDEPLSETGFKQAEAAGRFLSAVRFTRVFSSDLIRAKQTACTIMSNNQPSVNVEINYDIRLRERKYGTAEGKPLSEMRAMAKKAGDQCPFYTPPNGETLEQVKARARDFFEFLCQLVLEESCGKAHTPSGASGRLGITSDDLVPFVNNTSNPVEYSFNGGDTTLDASLLVVTHGAFMKNWIKYFVDDLQFAFPPELKKSGELSVSPNTGISHFVITVGSETNSKPEIQCICVNRHDHLTDLDADTSHYQV